MLELPHSIMKPTMYKRQAMISRILDTPAPPLIVLGSLSASSVDITVRVWVKSADYWSMLYDINEIVYVTFDEEGIGFPFPQLTLHQAKD